MTVAAWFLFAITTVLVVVTFYYPIYGLGMVMNARSDLAERFQGVALFLPSIVMLIWIIGILPLFRGQTLFWLGIGSNVLLVPTLVVLFRMGTPAAFGGLAMIFYSGIWWVLVKARIQANW